MNESLKLEELHHKMWVWDNKEQEYIKLDFMFDGKLLTCWRMDYPNRQDFEFEEGRYYRFQHLENWD